MASNDIICKPTLDTFLRFGVVLAAFFGFGLYFFYDAAVGYRRANEVFCSYREFSRLGAMAMQESDAARWAAQRRNSPLLKAEIQDGELVVRDEAHAYPLPPDCEAARTCPPEVHDLATISKSWNDCWLAYSARLKYPATPGDHGYEAPAIREQWYAGGACMVISALILALMIRTKGRVMALRGDEVTAAGQTFLISDISCLDLRQWGKGFKGIAYATVRGRRIRLDGMTYGGFNPEKGEPAEAFMRELQSRYKGDIIEYEQQ
ncbi:MAG: hypothetical protein IJE66_00115 [Akkermansia sp.]|nr:hypothetical protein [Akkermansia sp.]